MRISDWSSDVCSSDLHGILIGKGEPRLALVRRDQVEPLELEDISPSAGNLAVGNPQGSLGNGTGERRNGVAIEDAVPKIAEDDDIGFGRGQGVRELVEDLVGDRAVVEGVDLEQAVRSDEHTSELKSLLRISFAVLR